MQAAAYVGGWRSEKCVAEKCVAEKCVSKKCVAEKYVSEMQVFTKMANWTADHKMTGVGNALKRHYRKLLWEYERANQRDIAGDKCSLCRGGTEVHPFSPCMHTCSLFT